MTSHTFPGGAGVRTGDPTVHIAVEAVGVRHGGGASVLVDFLTAAVASERVTKVTVFCSPGRARQYELPASEKIAAVEHPLSDHSRLYRLWWLEFGLPRAVGRLGADVLVCMTGAGRAPSSIPHVTFVQQSLPYFREAVARSPLSLRLRLLLIVIRCMARQSCRSSQRVLVQTPTMRDCLQREFSISRDSITVVTPTAHWRCDPDCAPQWLELPLMQAAPAGCRILYVGSQAPHKNVGQVIEAMSAVRQQIPPATLFLTWPKDHPVAAVPGVVALGYLDRMDLRRAYRSATLLVMPSLVETVGLPLIEAMSAGVPILAADRPYAHDVCGDAAIFFDPLDSGDLASKMVDLLSDAARREALAARAQALADSRGESSPYRRMVDLVAEVAGPEVVHMPR